MSDKYVIYRETGCSFCEEQGAFFHPHWKNIFEMSQDLTERIRQNQPLGNIKKEVNRLHTSINNQEAEGVYKTCERCKGSGLIHTPVELTQQLMADLMPPINPL